MSFYKRPIQNCSCISTEFIQIGGNQITVETVLQRWRKNGLTAITQAKNQFEHIKYHQKVYYGSRNIKLWMEVDFKTVIFSDNSKFFIWF